MNRTRMSRDVFIVGAGLVATVVLAARSAWIAADRLRRRQVGEVLVDLGPRPLAGTMRLSLCLFFVIYSAGVFAVAGSFFTGPQRAGGWAFLAVWAAIAVIILWAYLKDLDRIWLAGSGLWFGDRLYPWENFERFAWADDGRAFALRKRGRWRLRRWLVVPVRQSSHDAADEVLGGSPARHHDFTV